MVHFDFGELLLFWVDRADSIAQMTGDHLLVVGISLVIGMAVSLVVGMAVWDRPITRRATITTAAIILTIPSLALLAVLAMSLGLGWATTIVALSLYSVLPMLQNVVAGFREVSPSVIESARGMGMGSLRILLRVQLPIAWPVIATGVRVAAQLTIGVAAVAAYVAGPGLGRYIFDGLNLLGSRNSLNLAITGTLGIIILSLAVDGVLALLTRITTSRGLHV